MRKIIIFLILLTSTTIFGQINIGPIEYVRFKSGEFEQTDLDKLRSSKTLFVYRESDIINIELFKSTLKEVWDYTELEFISYKDFSSNTYDESYSFFTIGGLHKVKTPSSGMGSNITYIYLTLWMNKGDKKLTFCRIELYPTFPTYQKANVYVENDVNLMMKYLYTESTLHNWNLGYLKNALQLVSKKLTKSDEHWLFNSNVYSDLSHLKNDTLYIPEYTLIKFDAYTGDESKRHNLKELFKKYPYPYKVLSIEELSDKILNSKKPLYYLSYVKSCTDKFVSVVNAETGELLYSKYSPVSYNINDNDLKKLAKKINKSG